MFNIKVYQMAYMRSTQISGVWVMPGYKKIEINRGFDKLYAH